MCGEEGGTNVTLRGERGTNVRGAEGGKCARGGREGGMNVWEGREERM